jgi:hypothetical protein
MKDKVRGSLCEAPGEVRLQVERGARAGEWRQLLFSMMGKDRV